MLDRRKLCAMIFAAPAAIGPRAATAAEGDAGEKKKGGGVSYIQLPTLTATVIRTDGRRGVLTVEAGIDVADADLRARAKMSEPRLRATYVAFLQTYAGELGAGAPPDADYIAHQLQVLTNQVLGRPGARLLLGTILVT
jgi:hypothetical protein